MGNLKELIPAVTGIGKIHFKTHNRHLSIDPEKIFFCKADGSYTRVVIENCSDILVSKTLKTFQKYIPEEMFLRCHYSYLINVKMVQSFNSKKKIVVFNRCYVPVSRRKSSIIFSNLSVLGIHDINYSTQIHDFLTPNKKK